MNYLVMYSKLVSPYYIWNRKFVIACQNFHFWTKNGSTHLDSHYSNDTNWLHFRSTLHIQFQNKKKIFKSQKYFLTNQKSSSQLQLTIYSWATPTPYKPTINSTPWLKVYLIYHCHLPVSQPFWLGTCWRHLLTKAWYW